MPLYQDFRCFPFDDCARYCNMLDISQTHLCVMGLVFTRRFIEQEDRFLIFKVPEEEYKCYPENLSAAC